MPTQFLLISWQSPLSLLGPAWTSRPGLFQPACLPARLQTLQSETRIVVGDVAGLFALKPAEKSQQSMANNIASGCGIDRSITLKLSNGEESPESGEIKGGVGKDENLKTQLDQNSFL